MFQTHHLQYLDMERLKVFIITVSNIMLQTVTNSKIHILLQCGILNSPIEFRLEKKKQFSFQLTLLLMVNINLSIFF